MARRFATRLLLLPALGAALIHSPKFEKDTRSLFEIETFGFLPGGRMEFEITDFAVLEQRPEESYECLPASNYGNTSATCHYEVGLMMKRTTSKSATQQDIEIAMETGDCMLEKAVVGDDILLDLSRPEDWGGPITFAYDVPRGKEGFYSLIFNRCRPAQAEVSFQLSARFYNPGPSYLSAGDAALPSVYYMFAAVFAVALGVWVQVLRRSEEGTVMKIHKLMAALVVFKVMTLLFDGVRFHVIAATGHRDGWTIVFYIFTFLRSIFLFVVILLIGTGWSVLKPSLSDREKKVVFLVLSLQVLDNIALIVLDETAPGSQAYLTWRDVLHLVDIICCCAILFPIVWSIRHLRQGASTDGKAAQSLKRLETFRLFYVYVITYVYFTRIVVYLLAATLPFQYGFMKVVFEEGATIVFYVMTGLKFRPASDNPYMRLSVHDDEEDAAVEEFALEGDEGSGLELKPGATLLTEV